MPELPEVETARKLIHSKCLNRKIIAPNILADDIIFGGFYEAIQSHLKNNILVNTGRHGKYFILYFEKAPHLVCHLGMTGNIEFDDGSSIFLKSQNKTDFVWPPKFFKMELAFKDETGGESIRLALTDPRRLARIKLLHDPLNMAPISKLGFDPLNNPPTIQEFHDKIVSRRLPIKSLLLDQSFSAGIGNWLADEILYQSRIHPSQYSDSLSFEQNSEIFNNMLEICSKAVSVDADHTKFPINWIFLHRWNKGKKGVENLINGKKIVYLTVGGRTSAVVPSLQKVFKTPTKKHKTTKVEKKEKAQKAKIIKLKSDKVKSIKAKSEQKTSVDVDNYIQRRRSIRILAKKLN